MIKYITYSLVFQEIPDEITLALEITNCPHHCKNCHSADLQKDIGYPLDYLRITNLLADNPDITCVCLMGGDADHVDVIRVAKIIKAAGFKTAMYSGDSDIDEKLIPYLDYYKVGPYIEELGPINVESSNQKLYNIVDDKLIDITYRMRQNKML